ncbi:MAG: GAF domain-containing protein [Candidatus Methanomethylophilaceae archaeon]
MYSVLLVSPDRSFLNQAQKFLPNLDRDLDVIPATDVPSAAGILKDGTTVDVIVFDHRGANDFFSAMDSFDRMKIMRPMIMLSSDSDPSVISEAVNRHVDAHVVTNGRNSIDLFQELDRRIVMTVERDRNDKEHHVNERRMEALIQMAKMSDKGFQEVVNYALETSLELTRSSSGYVAMYDKDKRVLNMLAWSKGAMRRCDVSDYPLDFDLDTTGIWGEPIRQGRSIILNDYKGYRGSEKRGLPHGHIPLDRLLMIPIFYEGEIVATAGVGNKDSDYTWSDEVQLTMMMNELFSIYFKLEATKGFNMQMKMVRDLMESGSVGFMYVRDGKDAYIMNSISAQVLGIEVPIPSKVSLDDLGGDGIDRVRTMINAARITGRIQRSHLVAPGPEPKTYEVSVSGTANGFNVVFSDVTDVQVMDERIGRAVGHIEILEGPVLRSLNDNVSSLTSAAPRLEETQANALHRVRDAVQFMDDYRSVGLRDPIWAGIDDLIGRVIRQIDLGRVQLRLSVEGLQIRVDPSFHSVFKHLIVNSLEHGRDVTVIEIRCRIKDGNLTIIYSDNGVGMSPEEEESVFDQVYRGKFGMFLVENIVVASGMTIDCVHSAGGVLFEINVPPSGYRLG